LRPVDGEVQNRYPVKAKKEGKSAEGVKHRLKANLSGVVL
jgi:hypothetical protein